MSRHKEKRHRHDDDDVREIAEQMSPEASPTDAGADAYSPENYEALLAERDDLRAKYHRALADYQNAQRRFTSDMASARVAGVERVLSSLLPVLDHFDLALGQHGASVSAEQILSGVKMIRDEFNRAMSAFGVVPIVPAVNDEFNPSEHEALSQLAAAGVEPGRISSVYQLGYRLGDRVIRPAKVTIAPERPLDHDEPPQIKVI
jgi:molecular chaperone GrpE